MTAWTICKGILLAVGILFVGIPSPPDTYGSSSPSYLCRCLGVPR